MKRLLLLLTLFYPLASLLAQPGTISVDTTQTSPDTIQLMSGKKLVGFVRGQSDDEVKVRVPKKDAFKLEFVDIDLVFAVKHPNGKEDMVYRQDTLFGNYFTPQEVRYFMRGETDASRGFRCPLVTAGSVLVSGATAAYLGPFYGLPGCFVYGGLTTFARVKIKPNTVSDPETLKFDTYLLGYEKEARKRRLFRSMVWGFGGYVAGLALRYTLLKQTD